MLKNPHFNLCTIIISNNILFSLINHSNSIIYYSQIKLVYIFHKIQSLIHHSLKKYEHFVGKLLVLNTLSEYCCHTYVLSSTIVSKYLRKENNKHSIVCCVCTQEHFFLVLPQYQKFSQFSYITFSTLFFFSLSSILSYQLFELVFHFFLETTIYLHYSRNNQYQ